MPPQDIRELRDLVRYRRKLVQVRSAERNRLLKLLETANIKLSSVLSDVFGASGKLMLRALLTGEASAEEMARLAKGSLRKKMAELELALEGRIEHHHRFLLGLQLRRLDHLDADINLLDARIQEKMAPFRVQAELLSGIPGVSSVVSRHTHRRDGCGHELLPERKPPGGVGRRLPWQSRERGQAQECKGAEG